MSKAAEAKGIDQHDQIGAQLFGAVEKTITEDKLARDDIYRDDRDEYMIRETDLVLAPRTGHPWALDK
ncbi:MAG: hypothetical protein AAGD92_12710 [Pseudomonadota bacterium]